MSQLRTLIATVEDPTVSDAEACLASDQLAATVDVVMRGHASLREKIEAIRIVEARGWDALLLGYLKLLAAQIEQTVG